jgi:hypothetical protein
MVRPWSLGELKRFAQEKLALTHGFTVATGCATVRNKGVVMGGEPMQRFEELRDLIAIKRDVEEFSTLVTELNQLDPTRRLPVISKAATTETDCAKLISRLDLRIA